MGQRVRRRLARGELAPGEAGPGVVGLARVWWGWPVCGEAGRLQKLARVLGPACWPIPVSP
jgi:hypothetical protein